MANTNFKMVIDNKPMLVYTNYCKISKNAIKKFNGKK